MARSPFDPDSICLSVDVEWAHPEVLADLASLFTTAGLKATFFVTHDGVAVPGHERGLHPNYRFAGDTMRALYSARDPRVALTEAEMHGHVVSTTLRFAPEAKGVRAHSLYFESTLLPIYRRAGLQYECSMLMPLARAIAPVWREHSMLVIPTYYADHCDVMSGMTDFVLDRLGLDRPGLKVFDFHPNLVYLNSPTDDHYQATKSFYHDPEQLRAARHGGRGVRTLLIDLLDAIVARGLPVATLDGINAAVRAAA